jgi:uncharacterized protein
MSPFMDLTDSGVVLNIYVQPRAGKNELINVHGKELKVRLTSPPVDGAANKLCREFFSKLLHVSKSSVSLISGERSRHKRLLISGRGIEEIRGRLLEHLKVPVREG